MEQLIKTTSKEMSGAEKAAILLAEIGPMFNENYDALEKALKLSPSEMKKLRKTMANFVPYRLSENGEAAGLAQIRRENAVLGEFLNFCQMKGFYNPEAAEARRRSQTQQMAADVKKNSPEEIAKILSGWIGRK